jgi:UDP-GlcNAc:undecaprenyl-phosphate/decaprenyl-phosphate GlcNAc-1-phosphate transferase
MAPSAPWTAASLPEMPDMLHPLYTFIVAKHRAAPVPDVPSALDAVYAFLVAGVIAWLLVPYAERLARRIGAIDYPKERGLHEKPTPKLGGVAILAGVLVAGAIFLPWDGETRAILAGAAVIAAVGVVDDIYDLHPLPKLIGQIGAALIPVLAGVHPTNMTLPFVGGLDLGWVAYPATVLGIVAVINTLNFIDGVDGLASGVCAIASLAFAVIALSLDRNAAGVLAALTAGASLGFLRHGFPPASSFMGDTGSNLLGYLIAVEVVQGALKTNAVIALALPLVVLAVPILDTGFVVAKRLKYRQPIYRPDTWHFHHRMANIGFSQRQTLAYLYGWTLTLAGLALALRFIPYSDDHGHFHAGWTALMAGCLVVALAASVYLVWVLEILKLKRFRQRQIADSEGAPTVSEEAVDEGVARELETGEFKTLDPDTGEVQALDPDTGEIEIGPRPSQ